MSIPFTFKWIYDKLVSYCRSLPPKGKNYRYIRNEIREKLKFLFFKLPLYNIIVLKNYYGKKNFVISVTPLFGKEKIIILKQPNKIYVYKCNKDVNVFTAFHYKNVEECGYVG